MRGLSSLSVRVGDSLLDLVPAVHYRVPFAEAVNAIACDKNSRPDVIAVEMGPGIAAAVAIWLEELAVGPTRRSILPCLLGLVTNQRFLSPTIREKAEALQRETGLELEELPAEVLELELDYKPSALVPLSPTDSIIEAVRCALELNVPVYGVDLEEHAPVDQGDFIFPDASVATGRVAAYVNENAPLSDSQTATLVNERRELAMAARLKELLEGHRRVLFTCGLGHWRHIVRLVSDSEVQATNNLHSLVTSDLTDSYQRVVIDPSIAFQFLDRLPAVARLYERRRRHPLLSLEKKPPKPISIPEVFELTLRHGIRNHVRSPDVGDSERNFANRRLSRLVGFPNLLLNHAALGLSEVPPITTTLRCAKTFVSESFATSLAKLFFRFPWANAKDYCECETLLPSKSIAGTGHTLCIRRGRVFALPTSVNGTRELEWVGLNDSPLGPPSGLETASKEKKNGYHFTWTPWENLITGLSDDSISLSLKEQAPRFAEPFRGSLQRGIAWKETLLSRARGHKDLYVYDTPSTFAVQPSDLSEGWPVIWIFDDGARRDTRWKNYIVPMEWLEPFLDPGEGVRYAPSTYNLSALMCYGDEEKDVENAARACGVEASKLRGIIVYGPVFNHDQQYAHWLKLTKGSHNPIHHEHSGIPNAVSQRCKSLGVPLGQLRWQDDIVRMAIPYGGRQITVVLPKHCKLDPVTYQEAARMGKRLALVSLDRFSVGDVERVQKNLMVPGQVNENSPAYATDAEAALAEEREHFAHRMPEKWKRFGF